MKGISIMSIVITESTYEEYKEKCISVCTECLISDSENRKEFTNHSPHFIESHNKIVGLLVAQIESDYYMKRELNWFVNKINSFKQNVQTKKDLTIKEMVRLGYYLRCMYCSHFI